ncbi:(2Fe-2S)-binding protein [Nannocystaceae bacterium ST9]
MTERPTLTRRGLFRSLGTAAIVTGCIEPKPDPQPPPDPGGPGVAGAFGLEPAALAFTLDGRSVRVEAEARTTLLELLRIDLDQTGAKLVCDRGACGACMVMVDGVARNSCMLLAHDVAGCEVSTVAGLAQAGRLSALQAAFVEHDALQCGFCTSGMLVSATALLRRREAAGASEPLSAAQVQDALAGNLCRCGTYPHVIEAVLAVAGSESARSSRSEIRPVAKGAR